MNRYELFLVAILRISAAILLLSIPTIFLPQEWMVGIHHALGLGEFPRGPIVWYMARSLSAMYATLGLFTFVISLDVNRYGPIVTLWCWIHIGFGTLIVLIDFWAGLPVCWTIGEGPPLVAVGVVCLWLQSRRLSAADRFTK